MIRSVPIHEFGGPEVLRIEEIGLNGESSPVPARSLIKIPDAVNFEQAAATKAQSKSGLPMFGDRFNA